MSEEVMDEFCKVASDAGIQVATHVIGDGAVEKTIDSYEKTFGQEGNKLRHTLVHCQITDKALLERIAKLGIVVSYQPIFLDYDMHIVEKRCGKELASTSYAFKTLGDLGAKIAYGTDNMLKGPAMTRENAVKAIEIGISLVKHMKNCGYDIIATGEMGIGNTTTSSAIASVLLNEPVESVTGKGAGLTSSGLERKIQVIKESIKLNSPNANDPLDVLSKVGGYDIAGLVGVFIGGAVYNIPIVIDGFISAVAALVASRIEPKTIQYMIPSHVSKEPAGKMLLDALALKPFITCEMCLGEGSGAVALFPILDMACTVYNKMSSFDDIGIEEYKPLS